MGFPGSSVGKESSSNAGDPSSILRLGRSLGEGIGFFSGESHGQRSLEGYSPYSGKELDKTEET